MADRRNRNQAPQIVKKAGGSAFAGCVFLGLCILIAGLNIGGGIRKLNTTLEETTFAYPSSFNSPSELTVGSQKYLTETEAAEYLNITEQKVRDLIAGGQINEYVRTDTGFSISLKALDEWFDNEAYQTMLRSKGLTDDE